MPGAELDPEYLDMDAMGSETPEQQAQAAAAKTSEEEAKTKKPEEEVREAASDKEAEAEVAPEEKTEPEEPEQKSSSESSIDYKSMYESQAKQLEAMNQIINNLNPQKQDVKEKPRELTSEEIQDMLDTDPRKFMDHMIGIAKDQLREEFGTVDQKLEYYRQSQQADQEIAKEYGDLISPEEMKQVENLVNFVKQNPGSPAIKLLAAGFVASNKAKGKIAEAKETGKKEELARQSKTASFVKGGTKTKSEPTIPESFANRCKSYGLDDESIKRAYQQMNYLGQEELRYEM